MFNLRKTVGGKKGSTTTPGLWSTRYTVQAPTDTLLGKISHSRHSSADITLLLQDRVWGSKLTSYRISTTQPLHSFFIYFSLLQKYWNPYSYLNFFYLVKNKRLHRNVRKQKHTAFGRAKSNLYTTQTRMDLPNQTQQQKKV